MFCDIVTGFRRVLMFFLSWLKKEYYLMSIYRCPVRLTWHYSLDRWCLHYSHIPTLYLITKDKPSNPRQQTKMRWWNLVDEGEMHWKSYENWWKIIFLKKFDSEQRCGIPDSFFEWYFLPALLPFVPLASQFQHLSHVGTSFFISQSLNLSATNTPIQCHLKNFI